MLAEVENAATGIQEPAPLNLNYRLAHCFLLTASESPGEGQEVLSKT